MKVHTNAFKEQLKEMGRELDSLITFGSTELGGEELNSVTPSFESSILKSAMKMLEIDSNVEIPKGSVVNYKFGVKVNGVYEYLDFGNYIVKEVEKQEDTRSWKIVAYDKMLYAMKDYEAIKSKNLLSTPFTQTNANLLRSEIPNFQPGTYTFSFEMGTLASQVTARKIVDGTTTQLSYKYNAKALTFTLDENATLQLEIYKTGILLTDIANEQLEVGEEATNYEKHFEYPTTIRNYIEAICNNLGLDFANKDDTFANYDREIDVDKFLDANGSSLGYTYRDVLDQLAETTASTICINDNDELEIRYINQTEGKNKFDIGKSKEDYTNTSNNEYGGTPTIIEGIEGNKLYIKIIDSDSTIVYRTQKYDGNKSFTISSVFSRNNGRYYLRFRSEDNTRWLNNNDMSITGLTYNSYYRGWYKEFAETDAEITVQIPECGYWELGLGFASIDVGVVHYVSDIQVEEGNQKTEYEPYGDTIDEEYLKDININFGEKYGPINSIVLSRASESDNVYLQDENSVATNGLTELKIIDNQIMNLNNRADFLPDILSKLNGLEYYVNDFSSTGITYYDICDRYNVRIYDKEYSCVMFNNEMLVTQGLEENVFTKMPEETETDYKHASKEDKKVNRAYIIAKKNEAEIEAVVSTVEETTGAINSVELTLNDQQARIDVLSTNIDETNGDIKEVKTGKGYTFNNDGLNISDPNEDFNTLITNRATQYKNGDEVITETSKDGFMTTDLKEKGTHRYSWNGSDYDMVAERIEVDFEYAYAHFYNGGDV